MFYLTITVHISQTTLLLDTYLLINLSLRMTTDSLSDDADSEHFKTLRDKLTVLTSKISFLPHDTTTSTASNIDVSSYQCSPTIATGRILIPNRSTNRSNNDAKLHTGIS